MISDGLEDSEVLMSGLYPIAILQKRYGPGWIALANSDKPNRASMFTDMDGPWGGDQDEADWMRSIPQWAAEGDTPDQALAALLAKTAKD